MTLQTAKACDGTPDPDDCGDEASVCTSPIYGAASRLQCPVLCNMCTSQAEDAASSATATAIAASTTMPTAASLTTKTSSAMDTTTVTAAGTAIDIPTSLLLKPIKRSQGQTRLYVDGSPEDRKAVADALNDVLSDGTKSANSSIALIVITGLLRVNGTEEDCKAVAAGLNGVSHGTKSVTMIACYDYDWMGGGDWALQTDSDEDVDVLNAVLNERANSELSTAAGSTATSKAGGMSAGAVVGVLFAIIAVVGVGAAAFKFRHKLVTMGRKDGGGSGYSPYGAPHPATEPRLAVTTNTAYEPNLADAAGILNAIADRNTTAVDDTQC